VVQGGRRRPRSPGAGAPRGHLPLLQLLRQGRGCRAASQGAARTSLIRMRSCFSSSPCLGLPPSPPPAPEPAPACFLSRWALEGAPAGSVIEANGGRNLTTAAALRDCRAAEAPRCWPVRPAAS
jgi:hypothetical protein